MRLARGEVWREKNTGDWVWVERKGGKYYSSGWITCADAVRVIQGQKTAPPTNREVEDVEHFEPVSVQIINLLKQAIQRMSNEGFWN
jgi:hypothetical protein